MRILDNRGRVFVPDRITTVPTGNLLWVDAVHGIDALAVRGRLTVPFKTLAAAKAAASSGDTIVVMPGTYPEKDLAKNGVNWHFLTGAVVDFSGTSSGGIFDTNLAGGACAFKVTGHGVFKLTSSAANSHAVNLANNADDVSIECDSIESHAGRAVSSLGTFRLKCHSLSSSIAQAAYLGGATTNELEVGEIDSSASHAVEIQGATAEITAVHITTSAGAGVRVAYADSVFVRAFEIKSTSGYGVDYAIPYYANPVTVENARILSTTSVAVYASAGSSGLRLWNCVLISAASAQYGIDAAGSFTVQLHGACTANKPKSGNVTTLPTTQLPNMYSYDTGVS